MITHKLCQQCSKPNFKVTCSFNNNLSLGPLERQLYDLNVKNVYDYAMNIELIVFKAQIYSKDSLLLVFASLVNSDVFTEEKITAR